MNVSLIGMMGSGKTAAGKILARKTGRGFVDVDEMIERELGMRIPDIFRELGEEKFRELERGCVKRLGQKQGLVISTGGGLAAGRGNLENLKKMGPVIWLSAAPDELYRRTAGGGGRPLLNVPDPAGTISRLLEKRKKYYEQADLAVDTTSMGPEQVAGEIIRFLEKSGNGGS